MAAVAAITGPGGRVVASVPAATGPGPSLDVFRRQLILSRSDLWVEYFALGGEAGPEAFGLYLSGDGGLNTAEHNTIAVALNEQFMDRGLNRPVPYRN
jgi:hypothetical protein